MVEDNNKRAALSFIRFVSVAEFVAIASLVVAWIYFFSDSSRKIIFLTLLHGFAILTSTIGFFLVRFGSRETVRFYVVAQGLNLVGSAIALTLFATVSGDCTSYPFCASGSFGRKMTTYFVILATWLSLASLIGLAAAMISLRFFTGDESILPTLKSARDTVKRTYKAVKK
jgi:hypothetical protein